MRLPLRVLTPPPVRAVQAARRRHAAGPGVLRSTATSLLTIVLVCALVCWAAWTYFVPAPVKKIAAWGLHHIDYSCGGTISLTALPTDGKDQADSGLAGLGYTVGHSLKRVADWDPDPMVLRRAVLGGARVVGRVYGGFTSGVRGAEAPRAEQRSKYPDPTDVPTIAAPTSTTCVGCPGTGVTVQEPVDIAARAIVAAGQTGETAATYVAIAGAESGYNPRAANPSSTARGMWQLMLSVHDISEADAFDPTKAARLAVQVHDKAGGFGPWKTSRPMWAQHMVEARQAVARAQAAAVPCMQGPTMAAGYSDSGVVAVARRYLGTPYVWGGDEPGGFDCSGLVQYAYAQVGVETPRTAEQQRRWAVPVSPGDLQPGDLIFWQAGPGAPAHHVGLAIGAGMMVDAPHKGEVVKERPIFGGEVITYGRVPGSGRAA